jgi:hypothetical protein
MSNDRDDELFENVLAIERETQQQTADLRELCDGVAQWVDQGLELRSAIDRCLARIDRGFKQMNHVIEELRCDDDANYWKRGPRDDDE